jgi:hypothetical protein
MCSCYPTAAYRERERVCVYVCMCVCVDMRVQGKS